MIDSTGRRNVFDQFKQPENRLSHALATTLAMNSELTRKFAGWLGGAPAPRSKRIRVVQQTIPGAPLPGDADEQSGLPDICLTDDEEWCLAIESKAAAKLTTGQLRRHQATVGRAFETSTVAAITATPRPAALPAEFPHRTWADVYIWMGQMGRADFWTHELREYMRGLEAEWLQEEYGMGAPITDFDGIPFGPDHPFSYREGKLLIRQLMGKLRERREVLSLGIDPACAGRRAITGKGRKHVWNFISLEKSEGDASFTKSPHLTLGIDDRMVDVMMTIPNGVRGKYRRVLRELGAKGLRDLALQVVKNCEAAFRQREIYKPMVVVMQRHYIAQKNPVLDGRLEADLRTAVDCHHGQGIKPRREWLDAAFQLAANTAGTNTQIQFGTFFPHERQGLRGVGGLDMIVAAWDAFRPIIEAVTSGSGR